MFRKMRRSAQQLSLEATEEILTRATCATLALNGDDGYPYSLPISFVYHQGKIYFHGAKSGYKVDCIMNNPKASISIIDLDQIVPERYTTYYRSVIGFGKISIMENKQEIYDACVLFAQKYRPGFMEDMEKEIQQEANTLAMYEMTIEYMTGKEAIELVKQRNK